MAIAGRVLTKDGWTLAAMASARMRAVAQTKNRIAREEDPVGICFGHRIGRPQTSAW
jgi:hypothetical protein